MGPFFAPQSSTYTPRCGQPRPSALQWVAGTSIVAEHIDQGHFGHLPDDPALWRLVDSSRTAFTMAGHGHVATAQKCAPCEWSSCAGSSVKPGVCPFQSAGQRPLLVVNPGGLGLSGHNRGTKQFPRRCPASSRRKLFGPCGPSLRYGCRQCGPPSPTDRITTRTR